MRARNPSEGWVDFFRGACDEDGLETLRARLALVVGAMECRELAGAFRVAVGAGPRDDLGAMLARLGFLLGAVAAGAEMSSCLAFDDAVGAVNRAGSSTDFLLTPVDSLLGSGPCLAAEAAVGAVR